jgi:hypothetical protein
MDKKQILRRLLDLFEIKELKEGFESQDEAIGWSNKVAPLLKFVDLQYYENFVMNSHKLNLGLSSHSLIPALNIMKSQMEMAIEELKIRIEMDEGIPDETYFPEESYLSIQKNIARIIRQSQRLLRICDSYMDEKLIEELTDVNAKEIRLLMRTPKGLFLQRLEAAQKQFPSKCIEARESDKFHDRYYIVDDDQVWSLGASYNKAGQKATLISRIRSDSERDRVISDFERWWLLAKSI